MNTTLDAVQNDPCSYPHVLGAFLNCVVQTNFMNCPKESQLLILNESDQCKTITRFLESDAPLPDGCFAVIGGKQFKDVDFFGKLSLDSNCL